MHAIILAAGHGKRMGQYGEKLPKGMLRFAGKPLLQWQLEALRGGGVDSISIVTGYRRELIQFDGVDTYHNPDFAITNMLESLMCARERLSGDVLIAYADLIYTPRLVQLVSNASGEIAVAVDEDWRTLWAMRYGSTEEDLESLSTDGTRIIELGREVKQSVGIDYRYIGLLKFSAAIWDRVFELYDRKKGIEEAWNASGKDFRNGYMTDLLMEMIGAGCDVQACISRRQWLEFDTAHDYEVMTRNLSEGLLTGVIDLDL